jgi:hypothetical protein
MRSRLITLLVVAGLASSLKAGIGETAAQLAARYGAAKDSQVTQITDKASPVIEGAIHHTYEFQGWKIRAGEGKGID